MVRAVLIALVIAGPGVIAGLGAPAARAQPVPGPPQVIGEAASGVQLGGLAIARDGTGGIVFLEDLGGLEHVFASRLIGGVLEPATQLDAGLLTASAQPVITGTNGGILQVAFINAGNLYVTGTASSSAGWSAPQALAPGASGPAIAMSTYGEAYLAFTEAEGGGDDVDVEYFDGSSWTPASPEAMNVTDDDAAGVGAQRASVAAAGDGVGIVAWGENGHVYSRRVWGTMTSVESEQLDPATYAGWAEQTADSPEVGVGGDSSYPDIAFREELASGARTQSRVLLARLIAEDTEPATAIDGLSTPSSLAGVQPGLAMNEYGRGFATAATEPSDSIEATPLAASGVPGLAAMVGTGLDGALPDAVPAAAGLTSTLIAWQQATAPDAGEIAVRYAQDGTDLGPTEVVSSTTGGSTEADDGLAAGGDGAGDAAVAWVQNDDGLETVDASQLYQPPGQPSPLSTLVYTSNPHPTLAWSGARESWGPISYAVSLDGGALGQTSGLAFPVAATLIDGPHVWQVRVTNPAGLTSASAQATVFVDTQPPRLRVLLSGIARAGRQVAMRISYVDPPNPSEPGAQASGIAGVTVSWGRRAAPASPAVSSSGASTLTHVFTRPGLYLVAVTATDRAGNAARIVRYLRVLPRA